MQPSLVCYVVVAAVNGFIEHVGVTASEADYLLFQPIAGSSH